MRKLRLHNHTKLIVVGFYSIIVSGQLFIINIVNFIDFNNKLRKRKKISCGILRTLLNNIFLCNCYFGCSFPNLFVGITLSQFHFLASNLQSNSNLSNSCIIFVE